MGQASASFIILTVPTAGLQTEHVCSRSSLQNLGSQRGRNAHMGGFLNREGKKHNLSHLYGSLSVPKSPSRFLFSILFVPLECRLNSPTF